MYKFDKTYNTVLNKHLAAQKDGLEVEGINIEKFHELLLKNKSLNSEYICCLCPVLEDSVDNIIALLPKKISSKAVELVKEYSLASDMADLYFEQESATLNNWIINMFLLNKIAENKKPKKIFGDYYQIIESSYKLALYKYIAKYDNYFLGNAIAAFENLTKEFLNEDDMAIFASFYNQHIEDNAAEKVFNQSVE